MRSAVLRCLERHPLLVIISRRSAVSIPPVDSTYSTTYTRGYFLTVSIQAFIHSRWNESDKLRRIRVKLSQVIIYLSFCGFCFRKIGYVCKWWWQVYLKRRRLMEMWQFLQQCSLVRFVSRFLNGWQKNGSSLKPKPQKTIFQNRNWRRVLLYASWVNFVESGSL